MALVVEASVAFIVCELLTFVSGASVPSTREEAPWCSLAMSMQFEGLMECKFSEEVKFMQVDFYHFNSTGPPVIAMSCDANRCPPNADFSDMLREEGIPTARVLSIKVHGVSEAHAGKYRCQAQAVNTSLTVEGKCSLRFLNNEKRDSNLYGLFVLLVLPIVAAVVITWYFCKKKYRGLWKRPKSHQDVTGTAPAVKPLVRRDGKDSADEANVMVNDTLDKRDKESTYPNNDLCLTREGKQKKLCQ